MSHKFPFRRRCHRSQRISRGRGGHLYAQRRVVANRQRCARKLADTRHSNPSWKTVRQFGRAKKVPRPPSSIEAAARRFWSNQDAVGKRSKFFGLDYFVQVVGVAHDTKYGTIGEKPTPYIYLPLIQTPSPALTLFFRSSGEPNTVLASVRQRIQGLDRNLPLTNVFGCLIPPLSDFHSTFAQTDLTARKLILYN